MDEPIINGVTLTNSTLANFMNALGEGTTFTTSEVALATEATTVTSISGTGGAINFGTSALNDRLTTLKTIGYGFSCLSIPFIASAYCFMRF